MRKILFIIGLLCCWSLNVAHSEEAESNNAVTTEQENTETPETNGPSDEISANDQVDKTNDAQETELSDTEEPMVIIHTGYEQIGEIKYKELDKSEDDLYADSEVKPLDKKMSPEELTNENNSDLNVLLEDKKLPELLCSDANLKKQVEDFIYMTINKQETRSVIEKRKRILMVNNLHNFKEISSDEITGDNSFEALASIMELKVNRNKQIYRVCASVGNNYDKFESVYVIIYQDNDYYKVVVSNLMPTPNQMDKAVFTYSW